LTAAVGRKTGVAVARKTAVADTDGTGLAETDGAGREARVVGTGFTVPATNAVALGNGPGSWLWCFIRALFSNATAANPSAAAMINANNTPARIILRESFGDLR
jgi:hypothetical protein